MKTRPTRTIAVNNEITRVAPATAMGIKILPTMKTKLKIFKHLILLCCTFATTAVFGQTAYTWTNNVAFSDLGIAANWNPNGVPSIGSGSVTGDAMQFDGQTTGPVAAISNTGSQTGSSVGNPAAGIYVHLTANQTSPVTFLTTVANSASSGIRFNSITIDAGAGSFTLGQGSTTNCLDTLWGTSNPANQGLTNNSANSAYILPDVRWRLGAGGAHTFIFSGTGDWHVTNDIANVNGAASLVTKDGPGTMYWSAGHNSYWGSITTIATPMTIQGGTLVLNSSSLFPATTTINITDPVGLLKFDVVGGSQTIANPVSGVGSVQVNNGTLTLSGQGTYTGDTILSGGSLVVSRAENLGVNGPLGIGGFISFTGGTLVFSSANNYDYSPRITNSASQSFKIDTAGQNVLFTNGLASSGGTLTKLGSGSLTLAGTNTYDGVTTVNAGKLVFKGSQANGAINVTNGAALGVTGGGVQITPATLALGTTASATLEFNSVSSTTTPILAAGAITTGGTITVNINSGNFNTVGAVYPLFSWGSGSAPGVTLGILTGATGYLSTNGNTIQLTVQQTSFTWTGNNNGNWDLTTLDNWKQAGVSAVYINGPPALFDDSALGGNTNVTIGALVSAQTLIFNNVNAGYTINSSVGNDIGGTTPLTKNNAGTVILAGGANTYTGATTINGGTVSAGDLENGGIASDIGAAGNAAANLVLNGGTLQYTGGGATSDRLFTLGTAGGTIDDEGGGQLWLKNPGLIAVSGAGARTLTLAGNAADELDASLSDNGGATALTQTGLGTWIVTGKNAISGLVTINGGILQVGNGGATGSVGSGDVSINPASSALNYNTSGTVTNGTITGTGSLTVDGGGTVVLPKNNSYSGGTTINTGTLQVGVGGATGQLSPNATIAINYGTLIFNTTGTFSYGGTGIAGGGNLIVQGGGNIISLGGNSYSGWTLIGTNSTFQPCSGNQGGLASSVVTNNGTLLLIRQDNGVFIYYGQVTGSGKVLVDANNFNPGDVTLGGDCDYTGGTFIGDNGLVVGDGGYSGRITNNVTFMNSTQVPNDNTRTLTFNRADDVTFPGNIVTNFTTAQSNLGIVQQIGYGTLTLTGTNTYGSGTVASNGVLQVGNGGTTGTIGTGPATVSSFLSFNRSDSVTFVGGINGTGQLTQVGSGTLTLSGSVAMAQTILVTNDDTTVTTNIYVGTITASNGTLVVTSSPLTGNVSVEGGTFAPASLSAGGALIVSSNMMIDAGTILVPLNKSLLPQTNITVIGTLTHTGGSVAVTNVGPFLTVGDKFYLFNRPVSGFATVTGAGATWKNDLAVDGSITALTVPTPPVNTNAPVMQVSVSGNTLSLAWPTNLGWTLQTNSVGLSSSSSWFPVAGSASVTNMNITINPAQTNVFFRMVYP